MVLAVDLEKKHEKVLALENDLEADPDLMLCYKEIRKYGETLLGGIHHICTNDYRTPAGAIVWTDHGVDHSLSVIAILKTLLELQSVKEANLSVEDKCALLCAAWLHDIGMFLRHPDFQSLNDQRKYHSRLARTMLDYIPDRPTKLTSKLSNQISEICELHQTKTKEINYASPRTTLLGNLLLIADALDIGWHRTSKAREGGPVVNMIRSTTDLSESSAIEWWVNDCISNVLIVSSGNDLNVTFTVEKEQLTQWMRDATHHPDRSLSQTAELTLLAHIKDALCRYLKQEHLAAVQHRGEEVRERDNNFKDIINDIQIVLNYEGVTYLENYFTESVALRYSKMKQLWAKQLSDCTLNGGINDNLNAIKKSVRADAVYLFLFDRLSDTIMYLLSEASIDIIGQKTRIQNILRKQRIQRKCGIIGHVAFCGLVTIVDDLENDPRRCYQREDDKLGLHSVMFHPLIRGDHLWAVVMVNRKKEHSVVNRTFRKEDIEILSKMVLEKQDFIIDALDNFSKPYTD